MVHGHWLFCSFLIQEFCSPDLVSGGLIKVIARIKKAQNVRILKDVYMAGLKKKRKINYIIRKGLVYKIPRNTGKEM